MGHVIRGVMLKDRNKEWACLHGQMVLYMKEVSTKT